VAGLGIISEISEGFIDFIQNNILTRTTEQGTELDPFGLSRFSPPAEGAQFGDVFEDGSFNAVGPEVGPQQPVPRFMQRPFEAEPRFLQEFEAVPSSGISPAELAVINDRTRDREIRNSLTRHYDYIDEANRELGSKVAGMRYTHQALAHAWTTGDMSLRPNYLTEFEYSNLSDEQKLMIQEDLGYVWDGEKWVPQVLEEEGYGLGGYDYGDFGGGFGGFGGGDYTPPIRTGAYRGIQQGGRLQGESGRLTAGHVPASHWRI
jgi:hypothetical protein